MSKSAGGVEEEASASARVREQTAKGNSLLLTLISATVDREATLFLLHQCSIKLLPCYLPLLPLFTGVIPLASVSFLLVATGVVAGRTWLRNHNTDFWTSTVSHLWNLWQITSPLGTCFFVCKVSASESLGINCCLACGVLLRPAGRCVWTVNASTWLRVALHLTRASLACYSNMKALSWLLWSNTTQSSWSLEFCFLPALSFLITGFAH